MHPPMAVAPAAALLAPITHRLQWRTAPRVPLWQAWWLTPQVLPRSSQHVEVTRRLALLPAAPLAAMSAVAPVALAVIRLSQTMLRARHGGRWSWSARLRVCWDALDRSWCVANHLRPALCRIRYMVATVVHPRPSVVVALLVLPLLRPAHVTTRQRWLPIPCWPWLGSTMASAPPSPQHYAAVMHCSWIGCRHLRPAMRRVQLPGRVRRWRTPCVATGSRPRCSVLACAAMRQRTMLPSPLEAACLVT